MKIIVSNLVKKIQKREILNIPNLIINEGSLISIVGPNGSGKTSLLNILAGLDVSFLGTVYYNDEPLCDLKRKNITMLFQTGNLLSKSVRDNISYPLSLRGVVNTEIKHKVDCILKMLKIDNLLETKASCLSAGETQKVSIARALVFEPKLLLLDEPTANLDSESTKLVEDLILASNKINKTTIIVVTHDIEQAKRISSKILYLNDGKLTINDEI